MVDGFDHPTYYPTLESVLDIHQDIIEEDEDADPGVIKEGQIEYVLDFVEHGQFGQGPETIHEKAMQLMRLLAANHSFVDGNKRTALNTAWTFYAMNGHIFDYAEEIKTVLKTFAVKEEFVDQNALIEYMEGITHRAGESAESPVVRLIHILQWEASLAERQIEFAARVVSDEKRVTIEKWTEYVKEYGRYGIRLHELVNEFGDRFEQDMLEYLEIELEIWLSTMAWIKVETEIVVRNDIEKVLESEVGDDLSGAIPSELIELIEESGETEFLEQL